MRKTLSFGQKIGIGFAVVVLFSISICAVSIYALRSVVVDKDRVINVHAQNLIHAGDLRAALETRIANSRGLLLTGDRLFVEAMQTSRAEFDTLLATIRAQTSTTDERQALEQIEATSAAQTRATDPIVEARRTETDLQKLGQRFQDEVNPKNQITRAAIARFVELEEQQLEQARVESSELASFMSNLVVGIACVGAVVAAALALLLSRLLARQIGSAVQHIQSSSTELQAAANQQTTGSREQTVSMNEIATTIKELVATARQIAESAQRVADIAGETARGARLGDETVQKAQGAVDSIKRQVDLIVDHMLDLGRKSQQIGVILEIINELSEQTNILSINASIEAAGAGEVVARFAVVADEIRKLADRVGGSTKEIKTLIEEIRSAVHTTVMATETGSKTVDAGAKQFGDVSAGFQEILRLVETTMEAAREIELSTKQQTTAVEQVNVAIANAAQAAKESETSSTQTLQTVSELTALSRDLSRLVQPQMSA